MKTEYEILKGESAFILATKVQSYLNMGYICQGGVCVYIISQGSYYTQAMIKQTT